MTHTDLRYGLKKVLMSTYQAASGAGQEGMDELFNGAKVMQTGYTRTHI